MGKDLPVDSSMKSLKILCWFVEDLAFICDTVTLSIKHTIVHTVIGHTAMTL